MDNENGLHNKVIRMLQVVKQDREKYASKNISSELLEDLDNYSDMLSDLLHDMLTVPLTSRLFIESPASYMTNQELEQSRMKHSVTAIPSQPSI